MCTVSLPLEELTRQLAVFIGPVAKFVLKKLAGQYSDLDQLYAQAAKQILSEADREKFLRSRRRKELIAKVRTTSGFSTTA